MQDGKWLPQFSDVLWFYRKWQKAGKFLPLNFNARDTFVRIS